jgi:hypothetical protein
LSFASITGLTSPVNAPSSSQWQFCAPSWSRSRSASISVCNVRRSVNGAQTTTSFAS